MNNPEHIISHALNTSNTKQTFSFSKSKRFNIRKKNNHEVMYTLPSTLNKKTCSFGYGNKTSLNLKTSSPPPGTYQSVGDLGNSKRLNTISFSPGRDKVKFSGFLSELGRKKNMPSPNHYKPKDACYSSKYGKMAARLPTEIQLNLKQKIAPGPGAYNFLPTELKNSGEYKLAGYKNPTIPRYHSPSSDGSLSPSERTVGPGQYNSKEKFGQSLLSKFKNSVCQSFSRSNREGLEDKTKKFVPGFKYRMFSQFSGSQQS